MLRRISSKSKERRLKMADDKIVVKAEIVVEDEEALRWVTDQLTYIEDEGHDRFLMGEHGGVSVKWKVVKRRCQRLSKGRR